MSWCSYILRQQPALVCLLDESQVTLGIWIILRLAGRSSGLSNDLSLTGSTEATPMAAVQRRQAWGV